LSSKTFNIFYRVASPGAMGVPTSPACFITPILWENAAILAGKPLFRAPGSCLLFYSMAKELLP